MRLPPVSLLRERPVPAPARACVLGRVGGGDYPRRMPARPISLPVRLRADPWAPDHGMGFEAVTDEIAPRVDPAVETADWSRPRLPDAAEGCPLHFVDGVRRVELRLIAEQEGRRVPGLFGSCAVGAVRCDGDATFADSVISRFVILGGGLRGEAVDVRAPNGTLRFEAVTEP